ncbi:YcxB family protein, partial [Streptomyces alkaliphilus]|uniref:YcxB family protein n=1 Tax=Streptomyces alkaliphilus TaxID=1472722 RepID=UPI001E5AACFA
EWVRGAGLLGTGVLAGAAVGWAADRLRSRRLHARVAAHGECRLRIHEGGIEAGDALSSFTTGWEDFPHRTETGRCLVLLGSRGMSAPVVVIPKRLFASPEEIEEARRLVARHTAPLTRADRG